MNVLATQRGSAPLPVDARGRRGAPADRDRPDHRLARPRGAPASASPVPLHDDDVPADQGEGGLRGNEGLRRRLRRGRVAVRGEPGDARRRRGRGRTTSRRRTSTRSTATGCGSPARARCSDARARRPTPPSCRRATSASSRRRRCTPSRRSPRPRTPSRTAASRRCRTASATRRCSPDTVERVIRGTTFPAGKIVEPGRRAVGREGRHDARARSSGSRRRSPRSSGSPTRARAPACRRTRSPTRAGRSGAR